MSETGEHTEAISRSKSPTRLVVVWIDWYAYHVARFRGLDAAPELHGRVVGVELVGGIGVHAGLRFREPLPADLAVETLLPEASWQSAGQWLLARLLWAKLTELDPEAVLVPGYYTLPGIAAALWARAHRRRSILMTESTSYDHRRSFWKERLKGLLLRLLFDSAVTGGTAHVRYLQELGFPMERVAHHYDVVDNDGIAAACEAIRRTPSLETDAPPGPFFLYVGRLAAEKNVRQLLSAWTRYRELGGIWPLVLVGDGPAASELRQAAASSPFGAQVHFAGHRGSAELPAFYAAAGCFVLPSSREPWGLVTNEAMAAGLPVLVSDRCGAAEDLVHNGENGFTFDPGSTPDLIRLLLTISDMEPLMRLRMGQRSSAIIRAYTPQSFGQEIAALLRNDDRNDPHRLVPSSVSR